MSIQKDEFGRDAAGNVVYRYTMRDGDVMLRVITYGARVTELHVPDREGNVACVTPGFESLENYLKPDEPYFGATVGRIANRVARGSVPIDGVEHQLSVNEGRNTLHGGKRGFDRVLWSTEPSQPREDESAALTFVYLSPDGDQGFPGNLAVRVRYALAGGREVRIEYAAVTDAPTAVNLSNHTYFNLAGAGVGTILDHELTIAASRYNPIDEQKIPTGELAPVAGTAMDFTTPQTIGSRIAQVPGGGYDHNYCLDPEEGDDGRPAAIPAVRLRHPGSGRVLEIFTSQPGVQFYAGQMLNGSFSGIGGAYPKHSALALEPQHFPDAVHQPTFPSTILRPGQTFRQTDSYVFSVE